MLRSFGECRTPLRTFCDTAAVLYTAGELEAQRGTGRDSEMVRRASSILDCPLDSVEEVGGIRL